MKYKCPDCDFEIEVEEDAQIGEIISCPFCGLELEIKVIKGGKVEAQELYLEGEDWGE